MILHNRMKYIMKMKAQILVTVVIVLSLWQKLISTTTGW